MERARAFLAEGDQAVHHQHTISQGVLRRFATPGKGRAGLQLCRVNIGYPDRAKSKAPKGCGVVRDFVAVGAASAEALWQTVENKLAPA
jgi:hypothetical protein